jgi:hypothetical protein
MMDGVWNCDALGVQEGNYDALGSDAECTTIWSTLIIIPTVFYQCDYCKLDIVGIPGFCSI